MSPVIRNTLVLGWCWLAMPSLAWAQDGQPYGINVHNAPTYYLDRCAEAGIDWIRVDVVWRHIARAGRGQYDWSDLDRLVDEALERGLWIYANMSETPDWANGGQGKGHPPTDFRDWYDFVFALVSRYRGRIRHWGVWNEPNLGSFWQGGKDRYIQGILYQAHQAIRAADPASLVVAPDLAHLRDWDVWLAEILRRGGSWIDIVSHHIYEDDPDEVLRQLDGFKWIWERPTVKDVIDAQGGAGKPFWVTETGWKTSRISQARQSQYYKWLLEGLDRRPWWNKLFFFHLHDHPGVAPWGIIDEQFQPKQAFDNYRDYIRGQARQDATFVHQQAPGTLKVGQRQRVSLEFENRGAATWRRQQGVRLSFDGAPGGSAWGIDQVPLSVTALRQGQRLRFDFDIMAPATPGRHLFRWRMERNGQGYFGDVSPAIDIVVLPRPIAQSGAAPAPAIPPAPTSMPPAVSIYTGHLPLPTPQAPVAIARLPLSQTPPLAPPRGTSARSASVGGVTAGGAPVSPRRADRRTSPGACSAARDPSGRFLDLWPLLLLTVAMGRYGQAVRERVPSRASASIRP